MRSSSSSHSHPSGKINIAASAKRLEIDNQISVRYYYRIADNILKQADIFREEKNIIDLYVMLLRYSSLVSETIPRHREYRASLQSQKIYLKKKLLNALTELEELKPIVQQKINELAIKSANQVYVQGNNNQKMLEQPSTRNKSYTIHNGAKTLRPAVGAYAYQGREASCLSEVKPAGDQFQKLSLSYPRPKVETLSRHSILGPNGLYGQWQLPKIENQVQYPSMLIDRTPVEIPSLQHSAESAVPAKPESTTETIEARPPSVSEHSNSESKTSIVASNQTNQACNAAEQTREDDNKLRQAAELPSMISFETEIPIQPDLVRQPSPPAILAEVKDLMPAAPPQAAEANDRMDISSPADIIRSGSPLQLHISTTMMDNFMKLAKSNTDKNLETCGVLAGSLKHRKFYVTALIIPKQECTSNTCQTTNEEEIFEAQDKRSLFPLGWIHTHPTQSCFMSSVDVHTHYSYQIMLPEAVAIVMAPQDTSRKHGIFRLTAPGGMSVIRHCQQRGFHHHDQPDDGGPIYKACTDVYMNPNLKFEVIDLR